MLTALGIIFGVAAVIAMLAIGKGAKQEIMEQMKMVGVNNILINPVIPDKTTSTTEGEKQQKKFSRGLNLLDVEAIKQTLPSVKRISPEISFNSTAMLNGEYRMIISTCTICHLWEVHFLTLFRKRTESRFVL
jgi:putative ABC transport system permease protein